ncbi:LOW QUALITY PROTEIN: disintegrin and metalloproteinase domain-containing protein 5-like [Trichechus inunguis]
MTKPDRREHGRWGSSEARGLRTNSAPKVLNSRKQVPTWVSPSPPGALSSCRPLLCSSPATYSWVMVLGLQLPTGWGSASVALTQDELWAVDLVEIWDFVVDCKSSLHILDIESLSVSRTCAQVDRLLLCLQLTSLCGDNRKSPPSFPVSSVLFPASLSPACPPAQCLHLVRPGSRASSAFTCLNALTAVIRARLQASAMFVLLLLLSGLGQLQAGLNSHKTILHTTVPEKISSSDNKMEAENNVAYIVKVEGKQYLIHLKKQSFLPSGSVVSSYDKKDTLRSKSLIVQMDCNYQGYVASFPNSLVTLNTCSGLRGILQFKNISYGIEPMEAVSGFVHMIYGKNDNINIPLLGDSDIFAWSNDLQDKVRKSSKTTEFSKLSPRYIEMHVVVDKNLFDYMGSDIKVVTQKVVLIFGLVNAMLSQLKLTVIISSIEIWSNKNKISTKGRPDHVLLRLLEWESQYLVLRPHHITYLFAFRKHPSFMGTTYPGQMCYMNYAKGVALYSDGLSLESFAVIIVQLLGVQLGLIYDSDTDACHCSGDVCTMTPKALHFGGVKDFSTCSLDIFKYIVSQSDLTCLQNRSIDTPVYKTPTRICGNGMLEPGECDCGTSLNCTHKRCCDPRTCALKKGMKCGSGTCCTKDCKVKPPGVLCRESVDKECDFNEYCNGTSSDCMPNTYVRDGRFCDSGEAFCYNGRCRTFDKQCQSLLGGASTGAPFDCFEDINARNDRYGNCADSFCNFGDLLCGKLVCSWPHKRLILRTNISVIYTHLRDEICVSTHRAIEKPPRSDGRVSDTTYYSADDRDETFVEDGSPCGPEMFCVRFRCKETRFFMNSQECNSTRDCNKNGICNNFNHCHCNKGFVPPMCKEMKGQFGSVDVGHQVATGSFIQERHATAPKRQLLLIAYICLPVLIVLTAVLIMQNKLRELRYREETESERSVTEDSSSSSRLSFSERSCLQ